MRRAFTAIAAIPAMTTDAAMAVKARRIGAPFSGLECRAGYGRRRFQGLRQSRCGALPLPDRAARFADVSETSGLVDARAVALIGAALGLPSASSSQDW